MTVRRVLMRLLAVGRRQRLDGDLDDEILAHLEMAERDAIARGLSPEEARRTARLAFGGVEQVKEQHRDSRSVPIVENLIRDLRYGLSSLRRNPGFAAIAIGVLALGMGANTAMFSVVDAVLLKHLPYPEPERMITVDESDEYDGASALNFVDWKRLNTSFEALSAESPSTAAVMMGNPVTDGTYSPSRLPPLRRSCHRFSQPYRVYPHRAAGHGCADALETSPPLHAQ